MKKAASLIFTFLMLFTFALSVNAEEFNGADLFTIDLPEEFQQNEATASDFSFENADGDTLSVTYNDNTQKENIFSPADMSKKEIEEYTNTLSKESKEVMKDFADDFELIFLSREKIKQKNGKTALVCQMKTTITKGKKTEVYYQTMYAFGGVDYQYTFTYTTENEDNKDNFNEVFKSIDIFEAETQSNLDKLSTYAIAGVLFLLLVAGIVRFIRTPEKRAQGKIK